MPSSPQDTGDKIEDLDFLFQQNTPTSLPRAVSEPDIQEQSCDPVQANAQKESSFFKRWGASAKKENTHSAPAANVSDCAPLQRPGHSRQETQAPKKTPEEYFEEGIQAYRNNDGPRSVDSFLKAAQCGNQYAMYNLGLLYENGLKGVSRNSKQSVKWYQLAARSGCKEAFEALERMRAAYPKHFGFGKVISGLLHLPVNLIALILTPVLIYLFYFLIPTLLIWCRGNLYFFTLPSGVTFVSGLLWGGVAVIVLILRLYNDFTGYFKQSVALVEFCARTISCVSDIVLVLGTGVIFCILEYHGIKYLLYKSGFLAEHPNWSVVILWGVLLLTGLLAFALGATVSSAIVSTIKEKFNAYY